MPGRTFHQSDAPQSLVCVSEGGWRLICSSQLSTPAMTGSFPNQRHTHAAVLKRAKTQLHMNRPHSGITICWGRASVKRDVDMHWLFINHGTKLIQSILFSPKFTAAKQDPKTWAWTYRAFITQIYLNRWLQMPWHEIWSNLIPNSKPNHKPNYSLNANSSHNPSSFTSHHLADFFMQSNFGYELQYII